MRRRAPNSVIQEAIARVAPRWYSRDPFPRTPALSLRALREREHCRHCILQLEILRVVATPSLVLPLPEGEGRGEGEQSVPIPEKCDFCQRLSDFGFLNM